MLRSAVELFTKHTEKTVKVCHYSTVPVQSVNLELFCSATLLVQHYHCLTKLLFYSQKLDCTYPYLFISHKQYLFGSLLEFYIF